MRYLRGLILLVKAIVSSIQSLGWVMMMFTMLTYMCGIVTTEFIGLDNEDEDPFIEEHWGDLLKSMFTLFQMSTLADWSTITRHTAATHGGMWQAFLMAFVLGTNSIMMNVALATLIEKVFSLEKDCKDAKAGDAEDCESWMRTPSSLASEDDDEKKKDDVEETHVEKKGDGGFGGMPQQSASDRIAVQTLSEVFDLVSTYVGVEGVNQRKLVTLNSLKDALMRIEIQQKVAQACPAMRADDSKPEQMAEQIWKACPMHLDKEGLNRQELAEACMALSGELSMNHFVTISQALQKMEKHTDHELVHLNKHQRKMNRRFLKLRHRLRKVYHFDGAPRKMVEMVNEMKRRNLEKQVAEGGGKVNMAQLEKEQEDSGEISLTDESSEEGGGEKW